jgi:Glycine rich protein/RTX calcium-binding nonapeptide repeat (4 copies)
MRRLVLALSMPVLGTLALAAPASAATETFNFTNAAQTWTVPAGVTEATFDLYGASGYPGPLTELAPGLGGRATATIAVTPGASIQVNVGGQGFLPAGGFNGGGTGVNTSSGATSSGGGGASDIRIGGTALTDRVLVAGGGGGAGSNACNGVSAAGGHGGGLSGLGGSPGGCGDTTPGGGATQTTGGSAGTAQAGQFGLGANGADSGFGGGGGGGGGGWYGGGGGNGGGGGGGSGYGPDGTGVRTGNGLVTVTHTPSVAALIQSVVDLNLPVGLEASLLKILTAAQDSLDAGNKTRACNKLGAFISQVQGASGNGIPPTAADDLIAEAKGLRQSLGCGPALSCAGSKATVVGTGRSDKLGGTNGDDVIVAGGGDDRVVGLGGDDLVCGSGGDDELRGTGGDDVLRGGGGDDLLRGGGGANRCRGGGDADSKRQC